MQTFAVFFLFFYVPLWFMAMWAVLKNKHISDVNRLTWVIVLIFAPVLGLVLYAFVGPPLEQPEAELARMETD